MVPVVEGFHCIPIIFNFYVLRNFHMMNIDVSAGVVAPALNTTSEHASTNKIYSPGVPLL